MNRLIFFSVLFSFIVFIQPAFASPLSLDILHYDIAMEFQKDKDQIKDQFASRITITLQNGDAETSEVQLNYPEKYFPALNRRYEIELAEIDGKAVTFTQNPSLTDIKVLLTSPMKPHQTFMLTIKQKIFQDPVVSKGNLILRYNPLPFASFGLGVKQMDLFTFRLSVTVPEGLKVISYGILKKVQKERNSETYIWEGKQTYNNLNIVIGPYKEKTIFFNNIPITYYFLNSKNKEIEKGLKESKKILDFYISFLQMYPYEKLAIVENEKGDLNFAEPSIVNIVGPTSEALAHEIAHQWWGVYVNLSSWLAEALASYFGLLYHKTWDDLRLYENAFISLARENLDLPTTGILFYSAEGYLKGPPVFRMLSAVLGEEKTRQFFRTLVSEYFDKNVDIRDLRRVAEKVYGKKLDWFFKEWVEGTGCLKYTVRNITVEPANNAFITKAEVVQEEKIFKMPVEILLLTKKKNVTRTFWIEAPVTEIAFETADKPEYLIIDPNHFLLIDYGQPVPPIHYHLLVPSRKDIRLIFVYGTMGTKEETEANLQEANKLQTFFKSTGLLPLLRTELMSDAEIKEAEITNNVLFLIGNPFTNKITKMVSSSLPLQFERKSIRTHKKTYTGDNTGVFVFACRNSLNPQRAIYVKAGIGLKAMQEYPHWKVFFRELSRYYIYKGTKVLESGECEKEQKIERLKYKIP